jgi:hypothetical protein
MSMTREERKRLIERTRKRNEIAIRSAERYCAGLDEAAERSTKIVERALRRLRQSA